MILKFSSDQAREAFVGQLAIARKDILGHCRPAKTRPDLVVTDLTSEQADWLRRNSGDSVVYEDVKFEPMMRE